MTQAANAGVAQNSDPSGQQGKDGKPKNPRARAHRNIAINTIAALAAAVERDCAAHGVGTDDWKAGIRDELRFWWRSLARQASRADGEQFRAHFRLNNPFQYADLFEGRRPETLDTLDVGCALFPSIGAQFGETKVSVTAADPLATGYNRLMDLFGIERGYDLQFGVAEKTADIFGRDRFDFILSKNSIDHSFDPAAAFTQICLALKPGGVARFEHFCNEAKNQNYNGFHQWNLEPNDGRVRIWNRDVDRLFDFGDHGCQATIETYRKTKRSGKTVDAFHVTLRKG